MHPRARRRRLPLGWIIATCSLTALGCASGARVDGATQEVLARNEAALEELRFGMSMQEASAIMGRAPAVPPWANPWAIGPQVVENPLDSLTVESPSGEAYVVERYAIGLYGEPDCPFVRGEATLAPLIYLDGRLVGWRWSYLESALERPLTAEERSFRVGGFCGSADRGDPPD